MPRRALSPEARDWKNVLVLATCQMLFGSGRALLVVTSPLIGYVLADERALATLPASLVIVGTALATVPASLFMHRVGRRLGFLAGALIGALGGLVSGYGIYAADFWLFCLGTLLFGSFAGFAQLYRFAATDVARKEFRGKAVSLVLAGGVVAAFVGPEAAKLGKDLVTSAEFLGAYGYLCAATLLTGAIVLLVDIPRLTPAQARAPGRPLPVIMRQRTFVVATATAMVGHSVMALLMTATPLAMSHASLNFDETALVIEWHSVGMFAPGFVTGSLIARFGVMRIILAGLLLQTACVGIALSGEGLGQFWLSLFLLGVGWNFTFVGGTTLLAEVHTPAERGKTQGANNFLIFGAVAIASLSSGTLLHYVGWQWVNLAALPFLAAAIAIGLRFALRPDPAPRPA